MTRFFAALIVALGVVVPQCCCLAALEAPKPKAAEHGCCKTGAKADHPSGKACECSQHLKSAPVEKTASFKAAVSDAPMPVFVASAPLPVFHSAAFARNMLPVEDPPGTSVPLHQRNCVYLI
jgi:hypothetical protein